MHSLPTSRRLQLFPPSEVAWLAPINSPAFTIGGLTPFAPARHCLAEATAAPSPGVGGEAPAGALSVEVTLEAGDLLYLPACWWHGVVGEGRHMILNWWCGIHPQKRAEQLVTPAAHAAIYE